MKKLLLASALLLASSPWSFLRAESWSFQTALSQGVSNSGEGHSVSLSGDGNTLAVGAYDENSYAGVTQIYVKSGSHWAHQQTLTQNRTSTYEGSSVSLSANGNTLAVGVPGFNLNTGGVEIYVRSGSTWKYETLLTMNQADSNEGYSVALSADGNTVAAGAPYYNSRGGVVQIYVRSGSVWSHQASLTQNNSTWFEGNAVALSSLGNTLAVGAVAANDSAGAIQIYGRSGSTWTHQATLSQNISGSNEGYSIALSTDGLLVAAGALNFNGTGGVQIYSKSGSTWIHQQMLSQNYPFSNEGNSVAISPAKNILAAGAPGTTSVPGAVQIYAKSGSSWVHQITLSQNLPAVFEGISVALGVHTNTTLAAGASLLSSNGGTFIYEGE